MNDGEVMRASVDDPAAFQVVFDRYHSRIFSYLAGRVGPTDAEDLASDVFVAAFRQRAKFRNDAVSAGPWLYGIAANLARRHYRSSARRRRAYGRAPSGGGVWFDPDAVAHIDAERRVRSLRDELNRLRSKDREVLFLYALADLSYAEIAEALDIPIGTVRSRLSRIRERLRNLLPEDGKDKGEGTDVYGGGE
jgi:RNA polymerase sigma factor (sigma-70 family)